MRRFAGSNLPYKGEPSLLENGSLKQVAASGMIVSFGSQIAKFVLLVLYQILIARLLTPRDFGLVAMAAPVLAVDGG